MASISKYILFISLLSLSYCAIAQQDSAKNRVPLFSEKGFLIGYGHGLSRSDIPEGNYRPILLMGRLSINPLKKNPGLMPGTSFIFFEPQVNPVEVLKSTSTEWDYEFGVNAGIQYAYPIFKNIYAYELISSGPHFISVHTADQNRGFIFSDNMGAGLYLFTSRDLAINLGFRIRHMSNANTAMPNHGINTYNFFFGISHIIRS